MSLISSISLVVMLTTNFGALRPRGPLGGFFLAAILKLGRQGVSPWYVLLLDVNCCCSSGPGHTYLEGSVVGLFSCIPESTS